MQGTFSPKQVAQAVGVSESSLKRWCDGGLLATVKTPGGHRRIALDAVVQFLRQSGRQLSQPELLGLPDALDPIPDSLAESQPAIEQALLAGDYARFRRRVLDLYLGGNRIWQICDECLAPAFAKIGDAWEHGGAEIYQERRAVEFCSRVLTELQLMLPTPAADAPIAFGGTLSGDPYQLATFMVSLALREQGWQAESYGSGLPVATLQRAIETVRPRLVWLSVSAILSREQLLADCEQLAATAAQHRTAIAIGGRALVDDVRPSLHYTVYCDQLRHLIAFAEQLTATKVTAASP